MRIAPWFIVVRAVLVVGLSAIIASFSLDSRATQAAPPAQAAPPGAWAQYCSQAQPGTVQVVFLWTPSRQGQQWLDLSVFNNGFTPGTFVSVGPLPSDAWAFAWDGLLSNTTHYFRVNTLSASGWQPSATGYVTTGVCATPLTGPVELWNNDHTSGTVVGQKTVNPPIEFLTPEFSGTPWGGATDAGRRIVAHLYFDFPLERGKYVQFHTRFWDMDTWYPVYADYEFIWTYPEGSTEPPLRVKIFSAQYSPGFFIKLPAQGVASGWSVLTITATEYNCCNPLGTSGMWFDVAARVWIP
jgi:hypothetical protein